MGFDGCFEKGGGRVIPEWNSFINGNCMDYLKEFPDNYFALAIVDPPYGAGFTEGGGCKGWFTKYHQSPEKTDFVERERERVYRFAA